ncbi:PREDICTED: acylphosphatase-1-like [Papilio xuthus]|uniref:Acylphosphatase n=2 Tax=Papilio xuthus TaxID=66420 RepID=A0AAJ6ZJ33_PAPXU|nr:PREDICTED: acylphosphatase-1-like [Papilio xuthus]
MIRLLILTTVATSFKNFSFATAATMALRSVDFEVFGRVQGVFFRKFTKQEAEKLGLKGWCMNTSKGTVQGQLQGPSDNVENMMRWLRTTGSPSSKIDKAEFKNEKDITEYSFNDFSIRKDS